MLSDFRFAADVMLGRLARWLRLLGYDTFYSPHISDSSLIKTAKKENRIILTRDTHFLRRKNLNDVLFLTSNYASGQLSEVINTFGLRNFSQSRCVKCNGVLITVDDKKAVRDSVPEHVYIESSRFFKCADCSSIFWEGSHMQRFKEKIYLTIRKG